MVLADWDTWSTSAADANLHAMIGQKSDAQSCSEAYRSRLVSMQRELNSGRLSDFGRALHTIQDQFAPGHRGWQAWTGPNASPAGNLEHIIGDGNIFDPGVQEAIFATYRVFRAMLNGARLNSDGFLVGC